nr:probable mitochondrial saccharopine dehydrogenase-like oxidoreductase At5g39410 [Solanum lycopersicum]
MKNSSSSKRTSAKNKHASISKDPKTPKKRSGKEAHDYSINTANDATVVRRTQSCLAEDSRGLPGVSESTERIERREAFWSTIKPARFGMNITSNSLLGVVRFITFGKFIALFGKTRIGRWLLLNFPSVFNLGFFRKKGPTEDEVASATFKKWFVGQGFSDGSLVSQGNRKLDMEIITRSRVPLFLLKERDNLPKGGVFPRGIVFGPTDLQDRLQENAISFDVIPKKTVYRNGLSSPVYLDFWLTGAKVGDKALLCSIDLK